MGLFLFMIRSILKTLYWNQWLVLAIFFVVGDLVCNWVLDLAFEDDVYVVIGGYQIGCFIGGFFVIIWAFFRFFPAFRTLHWLAHIHVAGTTITTMLIFLVLSNVLQKLQSRRYSDYSVYTELNTPQTSYMDWIPALFYAFLFLQLIWFVQLIVWYYYKVRKVNR